MDFLNDTGQSVDIYQDGDFVFDLEPGETRGIAVFEEDWSPEVRVVSNDGTVVMDDSITWEELEAMDFLITITEEP